MRKESWPYTLLKFLMGTIALFLLLMILWSTQEQERSLIEMKSSIKQLESKVKQISSLPRAAPTIVAKPVAKDEKDNANLFEEDPYFTTTLPNQLGPDFVPHGTRRSATFGKPDNLHPFGNYHEINEWRGYCTSALGRNKFGMYETLSADLALRMEEKAEGKEFWFYLRNDVYWQSIDPAWFPSGFELDPSFLEKHLVTAHDVKFYFDCVKNEAIESMGALAARTSLDGIQEVRVIDDHTLAVVWERPTYTSKQISAALIPLPRFVYQRFADGKKIVEEDQDPLTYQKNALFAANLTNHWAKNIIVGCGGFNFDGFNDRMIKFKRNPDHYFPYDVLVEGMEIEIRSSPDAVWQDFKEGKLDTYRVTPEQRLDYKNFLTTPTYLAQKEKGEGINELSYIQNTYFYLGWNMKRPLFESKRVRQALAMAIDRSRIIRQTLNGNGIEIHGSIHPSSPSNNKNIKPIVFDPQQAKRILEEEGWFPSQGDGIIYKTIEGKPVPFKFTITYYVKNPTSKSIAEYIVTALAQVGIRVDLRGVDIADLSKAMEDKDFDALYMGWALTPPPERPRQIFHSDEADKNGSSNTVGYKNKEIDDLIEKLDYEKDPVKRLELYHRFDEIIADDQPYVFIYTPKSLLLYRDWVKNLFIPIDHQDIVPGANVTVPETSVIWLAPRER